MHNALATWQTARSATCVDIGRSADWLICRLITPCSCEWELPDRQTLQSHNGWLSRGRYRGLQAVGPRVEIAWGQKGRWPPFYKHTNQSSVLCLAWRATFDQKLSPCACITPKTIRKPQALACSCSHGLAARIPNVMPHGILKGQQPLP